MATAVVEQASLPPQSPSYQLSENDYQQTLLSRPIVLQRDASLNHGLPANLVWRPEQARAAEKEWTLQLSVSDLDEIEAALKSVKNNEIPTKDLTPSNFCLSEPLKARLRVLVNSLYDGYGLGLIRGLQPGRFSMEDNIVIFTGLGSYFGNERSYVNPPPSADVIAHVRDLGDFFSKDDIKSPSYTNEAMTFHTDLGDIVSLFTLEKGSGGGAFRLASSGNIFNVLASRRPEALTTLSKDFSFDSLDKNVKPYKMPLLHHHEGRIFLQSFRRPFTGFGKFKRSSELPVINQAQMDALNELHFTAYEESIPICFENGDLLFVNNLALVHARDKFSRSEAAKGPPRHLLKQFLRDAARSPPLPLTMRKQWDELFSYRGKTVREETFPVSYPMQLVDGVVPSSGWSQNG